MEQATQQDNTAHLRKAVDEVLKSIEQEREKEIITRRFGLFDRKETLEQIGELLGITRERVRQLEKAILIRLKMSAEENQAASLHEAERHIVRHLSEQGRIARVHDLAAQIKGEPANPIDRAHIGFIAELSPHLTVINENDHYHHAVGISEHGDEKKIKQSVDTLVKTIKEHGEPITTEDLHAKLSYEHPSHVSALASVSKHLSTLKEYWGLNKWPTVNPKNIRDKIYVILAENGKPMHFSDIAGTIKGSDFKRKDVTTQAIHNELIKDKRFVLIGRGIYALDSWGYSKGTVSDIVTQVLKQSGKPMHRDEIVKEVLKSRHVKETTILLNLQSKPQFKRVSKATYALADTTTKA